MTAVRSIIRVIAGFVGYHALIFRVMQKKSRPDIGRLRLKSGKALQPGPFQFTTCVTVAEAEL